MVQVTLSCTRLTEIDLGQQSLDTVARGSIDALPALLATIVEPGAEEVARVEAFDKRTERRWTVMLAYPLLLAAVGVRGLRRFDFWRTVTSDCIPSPRAGGAGFCARSETLLVPRFAHANAVANQFGQAFRSSYVANFALAAFAVVLSLLGLVLPTGIKPLLLALETGAIGAILLQTRAGNRAQWHSIWLDSRAVGERLPGSRMEAAAQRDHGLDEARRLLEMGLRCLGLRREDLAGLKKGDARKAAIAALIRKETTVPTAWIARELVLGHASRVSHCLKNASSELLRTLEKIR